MWRSLGEHAPLWPGRNWPLGATWTPEATNFAVYSPRASGVWLCLFDDGPGEGERRLPLTEQSLGIWHGAVPDLAPGTRYGYRVDGPYEPEEGLRFGSDLVLIDPYAWMIIRMISGFSLAGFYMIVESWLNERADPASRGKIFGIYTMVNLFASTAGQMSLAIGDTHEITWFVLAAIFYCLALVPLAISSTATPKPLVRVKLDLRALWRNSPVAVVAVFCVGVSNGAFGTLSAVYAGRAGLELGSIALFASLPVLAGAISQIPIGMASDRTDRRFVLIGVALGALVVDIAFITVQPDGLMTNLVMAACFGAMIYAIYPVIVAHANDHADPGTYILVSGGLLMIYGLGAIAGPTIAGVAMGVFGPAGLFFTSAGAHVVTILFTLVRIRSRKAVPDADKGSFVASPAARAQTPETVALAAGAVEGEGAARSEAA